MNINSNNFLKIRNYSNCAATLVWRSLKKGQFFITHDGEEGPDEMKNPCREYTLPRSEEASRVRGWILRKHEDRPGLGCESLSFIKDVTVSKSWSNLCFRDRTICWVRIVNGIQQIRKRKRQKTISLEKWWSTELQWNLLRRQSRNQSLLWHCPPISIPIRARKWIDINPERFSSRLFCSVKKAMIRFTATQSINFSRR